ASRHTLAHQLPERGPPHLHRHPDFRVDRTDRGDRLRASRLRRQRHRLLYPFCLVERRPHGFGARRSGHCGDRRRPHQQSSRDDRSPAVRVAILRRGGAMSPTGRSSTATSALVGVLGSIATRWALGLVLVWLGQVLAVRGGCIFSPPPTEIAKRAVELWLSGPPSRLFLADGVFQDILPSLLRLLAGWCLAVAGGITLGT